MFTVMLACARSAAAPADEHNEPDEHGTGQIPTIDLRNHDFPRDGLARLDGEWAIYWEALIDPLNVRRADSPERFPMPGLWNSYELNGERLGGTGYASLVVRVLLPPELERGALRVPPASTSYRLWVNGEEVAAAGMPGTTAETTTPARMVRSPVFETDSDSLLVLLHVANFDHRVGGMWQPVWIGAAEEVAAYDIIDISYDLLLLGICLAFAAYNLLIYLVSSRRARAPLLFALFFLSVSVRIPTLGAVLATRAVPGIPWHLLIFIEYMTGHLIIAFFCSALQLSYPRILGRTFRLVVIGLMSGFSIYLIVAGVTRYSLIIHAFIGVVVTVLAYAALRMGTAIARGQKQARFGLLGVLVVIGIVVSEWAHFSGLVLSRDGTPVGFLLGALSAPPEARVVTHLAITSGALLLVLAAASLLLHRISEGLFGSAAREAAVAIPGADSEADPGAAPVPASPEEPTPPADPAGDRHETFRSRFGLTVREAEIAFHAAHGLSNKEIAAVLTISEATVRTHIYRIFKKTASQNRTELSRSYFTDG